LRGYALRWEHTVKFTGALYVVQAFQKQSKNRVKTLKTEMDLIRKGVKSAEKHYGKWCAG